MRIAKIIVGLILAAVTLPAPAQQGAAIGKVGTIYVRESRDLYYEKKIVRRPEGKELWAEIRLPEQMQDGTRGELAKLPPNAVIERGDLVEIRVAASIPQGLPLLADVTRVTTIVAKSDTLQAMVFGLPGARPAQALSVEAQACTGFFPTAVASAAAYTR